ncbi:MAG: hypothetical protein ACKVOP_02675 [Sphingomonadaceae bacterium]
MTDASAWLPPVNQPENPLFTNGTKTYLNACVGDNGGPYDLFDYGKGFFEGGHAIVQAAETMTAPVDLLVYPAAFSYRHGIELLLKQLVISLNLLLGEGNKFQPNHNMRQLWTDVVTLTNSIKKSLMEKDAVDRAGEMIVHFDAFDPTGQVFRYPESIKGNRHLADHKLINVDVLRKQMRELQEILERWYYQAADRYEYEQTEC